MKVLYFYKTAMPDSIGGTQQVIHQLASGGKSYGIEPHVLFLSKSGKSVSEQFHNYTIHKAQLDFEIASNGISFDAISKFKALASKVDIIHYQFPWPFMDVVHLLSNVSKPTIVTYQSDIIRQKTLLQLYKPVMHKFLSSVDKIIATSPNYLESSAVLQKYADKVSIIPNGIDKDLYPTPSDKKIAYWQSRFPNPFYLFVGVLRYYKGLHTLVDAAELSPHIPILIAGTGPVENDLKQQAHSKNLKNIFFLGQIDEEDKVALLKICHAFVFPSNLRSEAFGISLLESAMFAKPMISNEIGSGTSYINLHNDTGIVIEPNNPQALASAMQSLFSDNKGAAKMGANAYDRYKSKFTSEKMISAYYNEYAKLL